MPTLVYLSGWTSTAVQTDISMLESTPTRKEVDNYSVEDIPSNESTKRSSSDSSVESLNERVQTTKKVPNKKVMGACKAHYLTPTSGAGTIRTVTLSLLARRSVTMIVTVIPILIRELAEWYGGTSTCRTSRK